MKSGKNVAQIKERLLEMEQEEEISVYAVIDCGMETEQIFNGAIMIPDDSRYMMTIIVKDKR